MLGPYDYLCPMCGREVTEWEHEWNDSHVCPNCGTVLDRDYRGYGQVAYNTTNNAREIHSDSLAIHPGQAQEHRERFPDVPLDKACRPVFTSVKQRERYLAARGVEKIPHNREY